MKNAIWIVLSIILLMAAGCAPSTPTPTENPHSPEAAIHAIQQLAGLPELPVQFAGMVTMSNSPSGSLQVALYKDSQGRKFSVEQVTDLVVEIDARDVAINPQTKTPILSEVELKAKADKLVRATTPKFDKLLKGLDYNPGSKNGIYFFDWRTKDTGQGWWMPPMVQVALYTSGDLMAYINTLILPQ